MPVLENVHQWTILGSTGTQKAYNLKGNAASITLTYETSSGCTAAIELQHRLGSSAGPYAVIDASTSMSSAALVSRTISGPLEWIRPRLAAITAGGSTQVVTVRLVGRS